MKRLLPSAAVAVVLGSLLAGCAAFSETGRPSADDEVRVAAAFYPLQYIARRVAGDRATVTGLTSPGTEPHDLELSINQIAAIGAADVVLFERGFQPAVDDAVEQHAGGLLVDATTLPLRPTEQAEHDHDDEEHEGDDDAHDHGDLDPHFWHDPLLMASYGDAVAAALAKVDPDHQQDYLANAATLRDDLEALDHELATGLADCARHDVIVGHDAFGYLSRYGLTFHAIAGLTPDAEPNPARLAELADEVREHHVTTVFAERLVSSQLADALAADAGVGVGVLDPIEGLSEETSQQDYLSLMRANLAALQEADGCH